MKTLLLLLAAAALHGSAAWANPPMPGPVPQPKQIVPEILPLSPQINPADPIQKDFQPAPLPPVKPEKKLPKTAVLPVLPAPALPAQEQGAPSAGESLRGMDGGPAAKLGAGGIGSSAGAGRTDVLTAGAWFDGGAR